MVGSQSTTHDPELEQAMKMSIEDMNALNSDKSLVDQAKTEIFPSHLYNTPNVPSDGNCWPETISRLVAPEQEITAQELRKQILPLLHKNKDDRYSEKFGARRQVTFRGQTRIEDYEDHTVGNVPHRFDVKSEDEEQGHTQGTDVTHFLGIESSCIVTHETLLQLMIP